MLFTIPTIAMYNASLYEYANSLRALVTWLGNLTNTTLNYKAFIEIYDDFLTVT